MKYILTMILLLGTSLAKEKSQISVEVIPAAPPDRSYAYVVLPRGEYLMLRCNSYDRNCSRGLTPGTYTTDTDGKWLWIHGSLGQVKYQVAKTKSARLYNLQNAI
jgi:hypothetical protein